MTPLSLSLAGSLSLSLFLYTPPPSFLPTMRSTRWRTRCRAKSSHISLPSFYIYNFYEIVTQLLGSVPGRPNKRQSMASPVIISATAKHTATVDITSLR